MCSAAPVYKKIQYKEFDTPAKTHKSVLPRLLALTEVEVQILQLLGLFVSALSKIHQETSGQRKLRCVPM
jgi:hypothetical protein